MNYALSTGKTLKDDENSACLKAFREANPNLVDRENTIAALAANSVLREEVCKGRRTACTLLSLELVEWRYNLIHGPLQEPWSMSPMWSRPPGMAMAKTEAFHEPLAGGSRETSMCTSV